MDIINSAFLLSLYEYKYKKTMKLKDGVGMAGSKSTQTRFVVINTFTIYIPTLACFDYHMPVDGDPLVLYPQFVSYACHRGGGGS